MIPHLRILNPRVRCANRGKPFDVYNTFSAIVGKAEMWSALEIDGALFPYRIVEGLPTITGSN